MIDTHAHLDFSDFDADREAIVTRASDAGVHTIINIATDFDSCERVLALAEAHESMYAVLGVHPHDASGWEGERSSGRLARLAAHPRVVGIGEIGLDYYRDRSPRPDQKRAFVDQIAVARRCRLPIIIHNREAFGDIFETLLETEAYKVGGVLHCFSESPEAAQKTIDLGFYISVNGILTFKNATMAAVGQAVRLDRILLETDCPYLAPQPHRGQRNEPAYVALVAEALATIRGITVDEVARVTDENAARLFRLSPGAAAQRLSGHTENETPIR